jgi:hypothetical protein
MWLARAMSFGLFSWYAARANHDFWADPTIGGSRKPWVWSVLMVRSLREP